ncbi:MAG: hypothetical protein ACOCTK_03600 [Candidatus Saliniplasma sp.]
MEGLRITGQTLFSDQDIETIKREIASTLSSEGNETVAWERTITGESTLNTYEINLFPGEKGTRIEVNYGMSTLGLILTLVFLVLGGIIGVIILILWYFKMDEIKSSLKHAFPGFMPPPQQQQRGYGQGPQNQYSNPPPPSEQQTQQQEPQQTQRGPDQTEDNEWNS